MAVLTLTDAELVEIRIANGNKISTTELPDKTIKADINLGEASDYVFERVLSNLNLETLTSAERAIAERTRDATDDDVDAFVTDVLKPPQNKMFRRAVVFRCAGNCTSSINRVDSESAGDISSSVETPEWQDLQKLLYDKADMQIELLNNVFPTDAFKPRRNPRYFALTRC